MEQKAPQVDFKSTSEFPIKSNRNIENFEKEYKFVLKFIEDIVKHENKQVIIPVSDDLAYFVGNISNTKKCNVYIGDDYFVNTTSEKAIKIIENRKNRLYNKTDLTNKEINSEVIKDTINLKKLSDDTFEIIEEINDNTSFTTNTFKENEFDENDKKEIEQKLKDLIKGKNTQFSNDTKVFDVLEIKPKSDLEKLNPEIQLKRSKFYDDKEV